MRIADWKIGTRLALGFGAICVALIFIIGFGLTMLDRVNQGTELLVHDRMPKIETANGLQAEISDIAIAIRNMMLNEDQDDRRRQMEEIASSRRAVTAHLDSFDRGLRFPKPRELLRQTVAVNEQYTKGVDHLVGLVNAGQAEQAASYLRGELRPVLAEYTRLIEAQIALQKELAQQFAVDASQSYINTRNLLTALGILVLLVTAVIATLITRSITRPVAQALHIANTVASGDLTSRIDACSHDEMGQLLAALKAMNESLARTVATVRSGTSAITTAASEVAAGSMDLSSRTEQQASSLEETASSMEELTSTVRQNADNAHQANTLAEAASNVAARGGDVISKVVETMEDINNSASKISDIIGVIDGIAFQTNILALNAAVEAARAGEQGRGFAVVASEVRNLAQRSASAAKEIKTLIGDSTAKVTAGSRLVSEAGATMQEIVNSVKHVTDIMAEISSASREQTSGIEQINIAVNQMDEVTQQNAALVEQAAAAAESMQDQSRRLAETVSVFRIDLAQAPQSDAMPAVAEAHRGMAANDATLPAARDVARTAVRPLMAVNARSSEDWEEF